MRAFSAFGKFWAILLSWALWSQTAWAAVGDRSDGWFNYNWQKPRATQPDATADPAPKAPRSYSDAELWQMHPDPFQAHLEEVKKWAVMTLKPADVARYQTIQDIAARKASAFSAVAGYLNEKNRDKAQAWDQAMPTNNPGRKATYIKRQAEIEGLLHAQAGNYGLVFLHSRHCVHCRTQEGILRQFRRSYPAWRIETVDVDERPDIAAFFNLQVTPTLVLLKDGDPNEEVIAIGVVGVNQLVDRIYRKLRVKEGLIEPEEYYMLEQERGGVMDPTIYEGAKK